METLIKGIPELFGKSIGIEEPWYIRSIETKNDEVHVYVDVRDGEKLPSFCDAMKKRSRRYFGIG